MKVAALFLVMWALVVGAGVVLEVIIRFWLMRLLAGSTKVIWEVAALFWMMWALVGYFDFTQSTKKNQ